MRLCFSVLWFDDSEVYFDSLDLEPLQQEVLSWGFSPDIKTVTTPEEFRSYSPYTPFDLIIVDRNLEEYPDGQEFIAELRANAIYTEVIFYTSLNVSDLWDAIRKRQIGGVFVSSRSDILTQILAVGRQSIRKILDLENMRGIVMAEVGELNHRLDEIIKLGMAGLPAEQQKTVFEKFYKGAVKQNIDFKGLLDAFDKNPETAKMLDLCDSDKRWQNYNRLRKYHNKLRCRERIGDYAAEVLAPRNALAHGSPQSREEGLLFHYRGREFLFNDDTSLALRQTILRYKDTFSEILITLKNGQ
ncbi:MAG: response regulator [Chloroflexota bacterium]